MATLRLVPTSGSPVEINKDETMVGRDPTCDVVISDGSVSRKHARIERRGDVWAVVDQASANGTFIDSQRVADAGLRDGQELRFGAIVYRVAIEGGAPSDMTISTEPPTSATVIQASPLATPRPAPPPLPTPPPPPPAAAAVPPPLPPRTATVTPPPPLTRPNAPRPPMGSSATPAGPGPAGKKGKGAGFWIGIGCCSCLLLAALAGGGFWFFGSMIRQSLGEPVAAVRTQLADIKSGNLPGAYSRFSQDYRSRISETDFETFVSRTPALKESTDSTFMGREVVNNRARLRGVLTTPQGGVEISCELVKEDAAWKVSAMKVGGLEAAQDAGEKGTPTRRFASAGGAPAGPLDVQTTGLEKNQVGQQTNVSLKVLVSGFSLRPEGRQYRIDLAGDLDTFAPGGQRIPGLSKLNHHRLNQTTTSSSGVTANFSTELMLNPSSPDGTYTVRLTVRDLVSGARKVHEVSFEKP